MKKAVGTVCVFLILFGFTVSGAMAQAWTWSPPAKAVPQGLTELRADPSTDLIYGIAQGGVVTVTAEALNPLPALVSLEPGQDATVRDLVVGFQGTVFVITDTAVALWTPPATYTPLDGQPFVPEGSPGTFKHITSGRDGKLFVLYEDAGGMQYLLVSNPPSSVIEAGVRFSPRSLNLGSNGNWVTCRIGLSQGYDVKDIDLDSIQITAINGSVLDQPIDRAPGSPSSTGNTLMVKFSREELATALDVAGVSDLVTLTVSGTGAAGTDAFAFSGDDTINVKAAKEKKDKKEKKEKKPKKK
jgi:hypothetical protein